MGLFACVNRQDKETDSISSKEEITESHVSSKDSLVEAFVKGKKWSNFQKLDDIGPDTILYKRNDLDKYFIGLYDLQGGWYGEFFISNSVMKFFPKTMKLYRIFLQEDYKTMVFQARGKDDDPLISCIYMHKDTIQSYSFFVGEIDNQRNSKSDRNVYVKNVKVKIDNIPMSAFLCINELGTDILELRDSYGYGTIYEKKNILSVEGRKQIVDKVRKRIVDKIVKNGIPSFFNQIPNVEYYTNEGRYNAMRFNDKYRNNRIDVSGVVQDIDEPWGSRYKYRVKLEGCDILTDNRSVLDLNKGDRVYMRGICSNFDSNSYQLTMIDGFVLTNEHAEDYVRTMMNRTGEVLDERLVSIGDYNIHFEEAIY